MPTATFEKLSAEKKGCIIEAAIDEFAARRFSDASINRIVKAAGISRGSFYQYFKGKEDLYLLIVGRIGQEKLAILAEHPVPDKDSTFFEAAIASLPSVLEWVKRCPRYNQIGMRMAQDDSEFIQRIVGQMTDSQRSVMDCLEQDRRRGLIRGDVDIELVMQFVMSITTLLLREYYAEGGSEAALEKIKQLLDIIVNGITPRSGGMEHYNES